MIDWQSLHRRLERVFPEGTANRGYVTREMAAKTVFVLLYVDAVEGQDRWLRPDQVARMSDAQAAKIEEEERRRWAIESLQSSRESPVGAWYAKNTREPIRDETLRQGLVASGAVIEKQGLATTSPQPRYALRADFASLFDSGMSDEDFEHAAAIWREKNLKAGALARLQLVRSSTIETGQGVLVRFPNGERRRLTSGPSSIIAKAVIEEFAPRYLEVPGVLWLSESARKTDRRDEDLSRRLNFKILSDKVLPDLILVDLGGEEPLFLFVEVVASDGPMHEERRATFLAMVEDAGYSAANAAFLTAYRDRGEAVFRKTFPSVAHQSFAWCLSEPELLIGLHRLGSVRRLRELLSP